MFLGQALQSYETDADQASVSFGRKHSVVPEDADDGSNDQARVDL